MSRMPGRDALSFEHTLLISAPASRVIAAFFDERALAAWWQVKRSLATPRTLGVYALEWPTTDAADPILGRLGGVFHGSVVDVRAGRAFFVAEAFWLPPDGHPIGPMAFEVVCLPRRQFHAALDSLKNRVKSLFGATRADAIEQAHQALTELRVMQKGFEENRRWRRYYELLGEGLPAALERLKVYLEQGQGAWDLREY